MKHTFILVFAFVVLCLPVRAQTAASCNTADVQTAFNAISGPSATVTIPSGSCIWNTAHANLNIPAGTTTLTIRGQSTVSCTGTAGTSSYVCTPTNNTVLIDSRTVAGDPMWQINLGSATLVRITGISFHGGTVPANTNRSNGFITIFGGSASTQLRIDHCDFNTNDYSIHDFGGGFTIWSPIVGVADHNSVEMNGTENAFRDYGGSPTYGDFPWSQATNPGTANAFYIENNWFGTGGVANDCDQGGRVVARYNFVQANHNDTAADSGFIQVHRTSQGVERFRGCRLLETYNNYFLDPTPAFPIDSSGDGNFKFNNTLSSGYARDQVFQEAAREVAGNNCGGGSGNLGGCKAPPNGFGYCGTASSGVTSSWDANSITFTGYPCIDQTGRGQSDLLNGANFPATVNTNGGGHTYPHNLLEPYYNFNETVAAGTQVCNIRSWSGVGPVQNRDFYCQVTPFTGATGVNVSSSAPSGPCTAGPGGTYGVSPTGSYGVGWWDTTNSTFYVCTSTNVWTSIYSPYTYPHPLAAGSSTLSPSSAAFLAGSGSSSSAQGFSLDNNTGSPLTPSISITGANASQFSQTNTCGSSLANGSACTISVTFSPTSVASDTATLNAGGLTASLTGTVPAAGLSPSTLAFGNVTVNTSASLTTTLTNTGTGTLTVTGVTTSGAPFTQSSGCTTLAPSGTCVITVTFHPTAASSFSGTLSLTFGNGVSGASVSLTGTGVTPASPTPQITNPFWSGNNGPDGSAPLWIAPLVQLYKISAWNCVCKDAGLPTTCTCTFGLDLYQ